jgi:cytochrome d ubiquinol oxidase subunit I
VADPRRPPPNQRLALHRFALLTIPTPFLANSAGWVFTEMGRQPWIVVPNPTGDQHVRLTVAEGVSDHAAGMVVVSLVMFTTALRGSRGRLVRVAARYIVEGPLEHDAEPAARTTPTTPTWRRCRSPIESL